MVVVQNTFPLISPSAYYAAEHENIPVVQVLSNYRLLCPKAIFFRDGHICESCLGKKIPWPGALHRCYRQSLPASALTTAMLGYHHFRQTWEKHINAFIALTENGRKKFIEGGLPSEKISVIPNFLLSDPGIGNQDGDYALFVGRISEEKGVDTLIKAWHLIGDKLRLDIIGDGPLMRIVQAQAAGLSGVTFLGQQPLEIVYEKMKHAKFLIVPSAWQEIFGNVVIEAYASGLPVLASDTLASIVTDGKTGHLFQNGSSQYLAEKVIDYLENPAQLREMGRQARAEYELFYTPSTAGRKLELLLSSLAEQK